MPNAYRSEIDSQKPTRQANVLASLLSGLVTALLIGLAGERVRGLLAESIQVVVGTLLVAVPIGLLLGLLIAKTNVPGRRMATWLLVALLPMPLYLHAAAWQAAIGTLGWWTLRNAGSAPVDPLLAGLPGVAWIHGLAAVPWIALIVAAALYAIDRTQEEMALLDASPTKVLRHITLRHAAAGAMIAALWVAVTVAAEMTVTDLLRVRTFAEEIYTQAALGLFNEGAQSGGATLRVQGLLAGTLLLALGGWVALAAASRWFIADDAATGQPWRWQLTSAGRLASPIAWLLLWLLMAMLLIVPIGSLALQAGVDVERTEAGWHRGWSALKLLSAVGTAPWHFRRELGQSLVLGTVVASTAMLLGTLLGWTLCSVKQVRAGRLLKLGLLAGLATALTLPGPVLGILTIRLLNQPPDSPLASLAWWYDRTLLAPWLVQVVRATPIATLIAWPLLASVPRSVLDAAASEGAGSFRRLVTIAAPICWRGLAAGWIAAFAVSVTELPATLLVVPPGTPPVAVRIFSLLHYGVEDRVAGICLMMMGLVLLMTAIAAWLVGRGAKAGAIR